MFKNDKSNLNSSNSSNSSNTSTRNTKHIPFTENFVRCIILQETSIKGREILFDNIKSNSRNKPSRVKSNRSNSEEYLKGSRLSSKSYEKIDTQILEMIFGTIPVIDDGISSKLHHLPNRNQVMLTMIFRYSKKQHSDPDININIKVDKNTSRQRTNSVKIKEKNKKDISKNTISSSPSSSHKRKRSLSENETKQEKSDNNIKSKSHINKKPINTSNTIIRQQKTTIAVAILIKVLPHINAVQDLIHSHYCLIIYRMRLLCQIIYDSLSRTQEIDTKQLNERNELSRTQKRHLSLPNQNISNENIFECFRLQDDYILNNAVYEFQHCIYSLMNFPRLQACWLQIVCVPEKRESILYKFLKDLSSILPIIDDNTSKYLLSSCITCLLMYHHSWLLSIISKDNEKQLDFLNFINPLNQQVAQLYGCILNPKRSCKLIVIGKNNILVSKILFILSFFMRCCSSYLQSFDYSYQEQHRENLSDIPVIINATPKIKHVNTSNDIWNKSVNDKYNINDTTDENIQKLSLHVIKLPLQSWKQPHISQNPYKNIGYSLFANTCPAYSSEFVLMGLQKLPQHFKTQIAKDLWSQCKFWPFGSKQEYSSPSHLNSRKFKLESSSCIILDLNIKQNTIYHFSPNKSNESIFFNENSTDIPHLYKRTIEPSTIIIKALQTLSLMFKQNYPIDICILYFEDILSQIYSKSKLVRNFIETYDKKQVLTCSQLVNILNIPSKQDIEMFVELQSQINPLKKLNSILLNK